MFNMGVLVGSVGSVILIIMLLNIIVRIVIWVEHRPLRQKGVVILSDEILDKLRIEYKKQSPRAAFHSLITSVSGKHNEKHEPGFVDWLKETHGVNRILHLIQVNDKVETFYCDEHDYLMLMLKLP